MLGPGYFESHRARLYAHGHSAPQATIRMVFFKPRVTPGFALHRAPV